MGVAGGAKSELEVDGVSVRLSNLDKVLYPDASFTKANVIDYYIQIAPVLLPHVIDRPLTLHRYPNGVDQPDFYEKNRPSHAPDWVRGVDVSVKTKTLHQVLAQDRPTLVWLANMASLEVHPNLARWQQMDRPTKLTFDLDPGAPATIVECCRVALELRDVFDDFDLQAFPKTSGSKGMQVEVPLNTPITYDETKPFAKALAQLLASRLPKLAVSEMDKSIRRGKVFIDWSQNDQVKTTVAPYSLRARARPWVSTPITWEEVDAGADGAALQFEAADVLQRVEQLGDLSADVETLQQRLPEL
jgi:bifunctional non-homologous end joining protein LigD